MEIRPEGRESGLYGGADDVRAGNEEFEVETDRAGEWPMPSWSETVRQVVLDQTG